MKFQYVISGKLMIFRMVISGNNMFFHEVTLQKYLLSMKSILLIIKIIFGEYHE